MRRPDIVVVLSAAISLHVALGASEDPLISKFPEFAEWFRSHGGTLDDRVTIGYEPGTNIRGTIATAPIQAETLLIHAPKSLILSGVDRGDGCHIAAATLKEMELGSQSKWYTYFEFDDSSGSHIPSQWDRNGRAMKELQGLPPFDQTHRHINWYQGACLKGKDPTYLEMKAFMMFLTRASDRGLIPAYDLMNHNNGKINTRLAVDENEGFSVIALYDISANEPIFNTYSRSGWESAVDVFNTYGFVEDYPQLWRWTDDNLLSQQHNNPNYLRYKNDHLSEQLWANSDQYEILMISPSLAALSPTKELVQILGNGRRSMDEWQMLTSRHHENVRFSFANALHDSAMTMLNSLPTTIEEDEELIEKMRLEKVDMDMDVLQAIEYRLAFKKALMLAVETAQKERFFDESDEL